MARKPNGRRRRRSPASERAARKGGVQKQRPMQEATPHSGTGGGGGRRLLTCTFFPSFLFNERQRNCSAAGLQEADLKQEESEQRLEDCRGIRKERGGSSQREVQEGADGCCCCCVSQSLTEGDESEEKRGVGLQVALDAPPNKPLSADTVLI